MPWTIWLVSYCQEILIIVMNIHPCISEYKWRGLNWETSVSYFLFSYHQKPRIRILYVQEVSTHFSIVAYYIWNGSRHAGSGFISIKGPVDKKAVVRIKSFSHNLAVMKSSPFIYNWRHHDAETKKDIFSFFIKCSVFSLRLKKRGKKRLWRLFIVPIKKKVLRFSSFKWKKRLLFAKIKIFGSFFVWIIDVFK